MAGAAGGALAGSAIEGSAEQTKGVAITVRLDNGTLIAVTQADDQHGVGVGTRVQVIGGYGQPARVVPL